MKCKNCFHDVTKVNKHGKERLFMCMQEDCNCLEPEVDCKHLRESGVYFSIKKCDTGYSLEEYLGGRFICAITNIRFCPFCGEKLK